MSNFTSPPAELGVYLRLIKTLLVATDEAETQPNGYAEVTIDVEIDHSEHSKSPIRL
jgi:hypothetical protein